MKTIIPILILVFSVALKAQEDSNVAKYPIIKTFSDLKLNQNKTAAVQGKLIAFQPINDGKTVEIEKWEWEILLEDNTKVPVRGKADNEKCSKLVNQEVIITGDIVIGKKSEEIKDDVPEFRIVYQGIIPVNANTVIQHKNQETEKSNIDSGTSLDEIISKYKGKVILIDFWASWCKPCMKEMKNSAVLHDELEGENIVFLYLAYHDEEDKWNNAKNRLKIKGEHYLLDDKLMKEVRERYKFIGIPWYVVIDKEGNLVKNGAPRPSSPELKELLLEQIKK